MREDTHRGDLGVLPVPAGRVVVGHQTTHGGSSVVGGQSHRRARSVLGNLTKSRFHDGTAEQDFFIIRALTRVFMISVS